MCLFWSVVRGQTVAMMTHTLPAGEVRWLQVPPGALLRVLSGRLQVEGPPRWLDGVCVPNQAVVEAGDPWSAGRGGWVALRSQGEVRFTWEPRPARVRLPSLFMNLARAR